MVKPSMNFNKWSSRNSLKFPCYILQFNSFQLHIYTMLVTCMLTQQFNMTTSTTIQHECLVGESLANLVNEHSFTKLKSSKCHMHIMQYLDCTPIRQTFFCQNLYQSILANIITTKHSHYMGYFNLQIILNLSVIAKILGVVHSLKFSIKIFSQIFNEEKIMYICTGHILCNAYCMCIITLSQE